MFREALQSIKQDKIIDLLNQAKPPPVPDLSLPQKLWSSLNKVFLSLVLLLLAVSTTLVGVFDVNRVGVGIGTIIALGIWLIAYIGTNCSAHHRTSKQKEQKPQISDPPEPQEMIEEVSAKKEQ